MTIWDVLIYGLIAVWILLIIWAPIKLKWFTARNKKYLIAGQVNLVLAYLFNFFYTGYFGWNLYAKTKPEFLLDLLTITWFVVAFGLIFRGLNKR